MIQFSKEIMNTARKMQESLKKAQENLENTNFTGSARANENSNDLITITMNGKHEVINVWLDAEFANNNIDKMNNLITQALSNVIEKIEFAAQEILLGVAKNIDDSHSLFDEADHDNDE